MYEQPQGEQWKKLQEGRQFIYWKKSIYNINITAVLNCLRISMCYFDMGNISAIIPKALLALALISHARIFQQVTSYFLLRPQWAVPPPRAQRGSSWKEQIWVRFEMKTSFRKNLRRASRNGKNYPMWAWHTQHSTMFICSQLILVTCSLWFERPASLEPFFLVIGRPTLWPDKVAAWPTTTALGRWHRVRRPSVFTEKQHSVSLGLRIWLLRHLCDDSSNWF